MAEELRKEQAAEPSVLELLLSGTAPNVAKQLPTARYEVERLSDLTGKPVVFTLQALPYGRTQEISKLSEDTEVQILLAGCREPDLKNPVLQERFGGVTPAETVKAMLLPGEIAELSVAVEKLSGYRRVTIREIKNA